MRMPRHLSSSFLSLRMDSMRAIMAVSSNGPVVARTMWYVLTGSV